MQTLSVPLAMPDKTKQFLDHMHIQIIAPLPEICTALDHGIPKRAQDKKKIKVDIINLRDFAKDKHKHIDDRPYGGGPGMVIKAEPLLGAIAFAKEKVPLNTPISHLSPHGKCFSQQVAYQLSRRTHLILVAGRYEGIDERVYLMYPHEIWSLGDFVLSGGELAALCIVDAISRLIPGVLSNADSIRQDAFNEETGLLDYPHYTRPVSIRGITVPSVLRSGNHKEIEKWRKQASLDQTQKYRSDLLK